MAEYDAASRSARLSMRLDPAMNDYLRCAADLEHKTITAFVLDAAWSRAKDVVREQHRLAVSAQELSRVLDELDRPAEVVAPLAEAAKRAQDTRRAIPA